MQENKKTHVHDNKLLAKMFVKFLFSVDKDETTMNKYNNIKIVDKTMMRKKSQTKYAQIMKWNESASSVEIATDVSLHRSPFPFKTLRWRTQI